MFGTFAKVIMRKMGLQKRLFYEVLSFIGHLDHRNHVFAVPDLSADSQTPVQSQQHHQQRSQIHHSMGHHRGKSLF